jgi:hypothetical protein
MQVTLALDDKIKLGQNILNTHLYGGTSQPFSPSDKSSKEVPDGGVRGRVVKVVDFKPLAPYRCGFESPTGTLDSFT